MSSEVLGRMTFAGTLGYAAALALAATLVLRAIGRSVERLLLRADHAPIDPPGRRVSGSQAESDDGKLERRHGVDAGRASGTGEGPPAC